MKEKKRSNKHSGIENEIKMCYKFIPLKINFYSKKKWKMINISSDEGGVKKGLKKISSMLPLCVCIWQEKGWKKRKRRRFENALERNHHCVISIFTRKRRKRRRENDTKEKEIRKDSLWLLNISHLFLSHLGVSM